MSPALLAFLFLSALACGTALGAVVRGWAAASECERCRSECRECIVRAKGGSR